MHPPSLFRGTALLTATGICSQILAFLYRIALSRLIGAENMGLFQLIMPVYSLLLAVCAVGLNSTVSTLTARYLALKDLSAVKRLTDRCISWFLLAAGTLGCLLAMGSDLISVYVLGDSRTQLSLILLVPCLLLTGIENLQKHFFYGTGKVHIPALLDLIEQVIRIGAVLALLTALLPQNPERTIGLIVCGMVICEIFSACTLTLFFRRAMKGIPSRLDPALDRQAVNMAVPITGTALINNLLGSADAILIPRLLVVGGMSVSDSMKQYGILFGMTAPLLCLPTAFIGSMGLVLTPRIAHLSARGQTTSAQQTVNTCLKTSSLILFPILACLCAVGPELGSLLFRETSVGRHMIPMAVGIAMNSQQSILTCALNGLERQKVSALIHLVCDAVQLLFTILTVSSYGLAGYIGGYLISSVLGLLLCRYAVTHSLGSTTASLLSPAASATLTGLCCHTLFHTLLKRGLHLFPATGICLLWGALLYVLCLFTCGLFSPHKTG